MPPPTGSRRPGCDSGSMLRLLLVASLCCGCFFVVERWGNGALRSDSGRMAGAATHAGHDLIGHYDSGAVGRRLLSGGPGSHPPRCTSKCGSCSPCSPVHVSVPPGVLVTTEYYPVAWRCKCRDRLYMP
ncbi:EPIDERMAL PATTERNING FACTOR-like protein 4 [Lolium rigidum]|uniref:EPIDERMAL PATTERNING FACTOR-like protein 4 n=1 Tax=Lolium rigidum TaxID=89674 RepID=UPI001F5DF647|nr:EPIDERMAL PATTERNING FACTOR-like protein 4 [Lolium rigidum]